jgi:transcriptional regulator with XRE-family HTH domain
LAGLRNVKRKRKKQALRPDEREAVGITPESSEQAPHDADDSWVGSRLRSIRKERDLSIQQVAANVGLSIGMISQIERGISTPSLRSLRLLANTFNVPVSWFFSAPHEPAESRHIVRRAQRRLLKVAHTGVVQELLSPESPGQIEIYEILLEPGGSSDGEAYSHQGEKAGLVISGRLHLWVDQERYVLRHGDSFRFSSTQPHRFANPSPRETRLIWIVSSAPRAA